MTAANTNIIHGVENMLTMDILLKNFCPDLGKGGGGGQLDVTVNIFCTTIPNRTVIPEPDVHHEKSEHGRRSPTRNP